MVAPYTLFKAVPGVCSKWRSACQSTSVDVSLSWRRATPVASLGPERTLRDAFNRAFRDHQDSPVGELGPTVRRLVGERHATDNATAGRLSALLARFKVDTTCGLNLGGCFQLTPAAIKGLIDHCRGCDRRVTSLTFAGIASLAHKDVIAAVNSLPHLERIDLSRCAQIDLQKLRTEILARPNRPEPVDVEVEGGIIRIIPRRAPGCTTPCAALPAPALFRDPANHAQAFNDKAERLYTKAMAASVELQAATESHRKIKLDYVMLKSQWSGPCDPAFTMLGKRIGAAERRVLASAPALKVKLDAIVQHYVTEVARRRAGELSTKCEAYVAEVERKLAFSTRRRDAGLPRRRRKVQAEMAKLAEDEQDEHDEREIANENFADHRAWRRQSLARLEAELEREGSQGMDGDFYDWDCMWCEYEDEAVDRKYAASEPERQGGRRLHRWHTDRAAKAVLLQDKRRRRGRMTGWDGGSVREWERQADRGRAHEALLADMSDDEHGMDQMLMHWMNRGPVPPAHLELGRIIAGAAPAQVEIPPLAPVGVQPHAAMALPALAPPEAQLGAAPMIALHHVDEDLDDEDLAAMFLNIPDVAFGPG